LEVEPQALERLSGMCGRRRETRFPVPSTSARLRPRGAGSAAQRSRSFGLLLSLALNMVPLAVKQFVEISEDSWIKAVKVALVLTAAHSSFGGHVDSWIKQLKWRMETGND